MADSPTQAFSRVPLFNGLSVRELASIAASAEERDAVAGEVITSRGAAG